MNLLLVRFLHRSDGIFSRLLNADGEQLAVTLEHAYGDMESGFQPKIQPGTYECVRGLHRLDKGRGLMTAPFETFEVTGVVGHTGILFHAGNWNKDSHGCILLGMAIAESEAGEMVTNSRATMARFMEWQAGVDRFELTVLQG